MIITTVKQSGEYLVYFIILLRHFNFSRCKNYIFWWEDLHLIDSSQSGFGKWSILTRRWQFNKWGLKAELTAHHLVYTCGVCSLYYAANQECENFPSTWSVVHSLPPWVKLATEWNHLMFLFWGWTPNEKGGWVFFSSHQLAYGGGEWPCKVRACRKCMWTAGPPQAQQGMITS